MIPSAALAGLLMQDPLEGQTWMQRLPQAQATGQQAFAAPPAFMGEEAPVFPMPQLQGREHLAPPRMEYSDIPEWASMLDSPYGGWGGGYMQARRRGLR